VVRKFGSPVFNFWKSESFTDAMLGLVEKTGADAQMNRANAAAARRVERSGLRGPPHAPTLTLTIGAGSFRAGVFGIDRHSPV